MQEILIGLVVAGSIIYAANMHQVDKESNRLVHVFLIILAVLGIALGGLVVLSAIAPEVTATDAVSTTQTEAIENLPIIELWAAFAFLLLSLVFGIMSIAVVVSRNVRVWIARKVIRSSDKTDRRYNPDSVVHTTAIVIALFQILNVVGGFILVGGIEGLAEDFASAGLSLEILIGGLLTNLLVALLGVGLFIRRDVSQTLKRLGLDSATPTSMAMGAVIGFAIFWLAFGASVVWSLLVSPETLAEQSRASEQLFLVFSGSFLGGFMLAATAAIGEEILFRGALQPIFGIFWTSIFFAALHTQYTLTPAILIIFGVSLTFGWLRQRYGTTAAIIAHFVYNFVPFVLFWTLGQLPIEGVIR